MTYWRSSKLLRRHNLRIYETCHVSSSRLPTKGSSSYIITPYLKPWPDFLPSGVSRNGPLSWSRLVSHSWGPLGYLLSTTQISRRRCRQHMQTFADIPWIWIIAVPWILAFWSSLPNGENISTSSTFISRSYRKSIENFKSIEILNFVHIQLPSWGLAQCNHILRDNLTWFIAFSVTWIHHATVCLRGATNY